jgi:hypothetical protein
MLELTVSRKRRAWEWKVTNREGTILMVGSASTREGANYQAQRALFLLLSAGYHK